MSKSPISGKGALLTKLKQKSREVRMDANIFENRTYKGVKIASKTRTVFCSGTIKNGPSEKDIIGTLHFNTKPLNFKTSIKWQLGNSTYDTPEIFAFEKSSPEKIILRGLSQEVNGDEKRRMLIIEMVYNTQTRQGHFEIVDYTD